MTAGLEFELVYNDVAVQHASNYAKGIRSPEGDIIVV